MSESRAQGLSVTRDLIRVEVDTVMFALEIARIREIVNPFPIIELPRERAFVLGVSDYREEVIAIVDLRRLFGLPSTEPNRRTKWIILESPRGPVGVVVDAVHDVFSSANNQLRAVPALDDRHYERGIRSAYRYDDRLVFLLDADRLTEPAMDIRLSDMPSLLPESS